MEFFFSFSTNLQIIKTGPIFHMVQEKFRVTKKGNWLMKKSLWKVDEKPKQTGWHDPKYSKQSTISEF